MRRVIFYFTIIYLAVFGIATLASAHGPDTAPAHQTLGISEPGVLPDSPFYFLKNVFRGIEMLLTFDAVKKAELELRFADEKLVEAVKVAEKSADEKAREHALQNYLESHRRLEERLASLKDKNKNVDKLLEKLADRIVKHSEIFEDFGDEFTEETEREVDKALGRHLKSGLELDKDKFKEKLEKSEKGLDEDLREELDEIVIDLEEDIGFEDEEEKEPVACIQLFDPVCGVDGKTYSNSCFAGLAKAEIAHPGECKSAPKSEIPSRQEQPKPKEPEKPIEKPAPPPTWELPSVKPEPKTVQVNIQNFAFSPIEIKIPVGSVVNWTNQDSAGHTATSDSGAFESGLLGKGESFKRTFDEKGTFSYHCSPHPSMQAKIIVE